MLIEKKSEESYFQCLLYAKTCQRDILQAQATLLAPTVVDSPPIPLFIFIDELQLIPKSMNK
jgi:hypothetical protein